MRRCQREDANAKMPTRHERECERHTARNCQRGCATPRDTARRRVSRFRARQAAYNKEGVSVAGDVAMGLDAGVARQSEVVVLFELPQAAGSFGVSVGDGGDGGAAAVECTVDYTPGATTVPVECGGTKDTLTLLPSESQLELRLFFDWTFVEAYFQRGRVAITKTAAIGASDDVWLHGPSATVRADATAYPIKSIWVDAGTVRSAPRVYH